MDVSSRREDLSREPFVRPSATEALRTGLTTARAHPRVWLSAFGFLVALGAAIAFVDEWLDTGAAVVLFRVGVLVGVIGYLIPFGLGIPTRAASS